MWSSQPFVLALGKISEPGQVICLMSFGNISQCMRIPGDTTDHVGQDKLLLDNLLPFAVTFYRRVATIGDLSCSS